MPSANLKLHGDQTAFFYYWLHFGFWVPTGVADRARDQVSYLTEKTLWLSNWALIQCTQGFSLGSVVDAPARSVILIYQRVDLPYDLRIVIREVSVLQKVLIDLYTFRTLAHFDERAQED